MFTTEESNSVSHLSGTAAGLLRAVRTVQQRAAPDVLSYT